MKHTDNLTNSNLANFKLKKFSIRLYFKILIRLILNPRNFFAELQQETGFRQSLYFLCISGLFFTGASLLIKRNYNLVGMGGILFVNAIGMVFIAAGIGYIVMTMILGKRMKFNTIFNIYAFSSGVALLISWVPSFSWFTEICRWWLIGIGLVTCCGFKLIQALLVIGLSIGIIILFFWSVQPLLTYL